MTEKQLALHWLMVGYVSPQAKQWIEEKGGQVKQVNEEPALFAVALAYDPDGVWRYSHGEPELRKGIEYWGETEIQEASTGLNLQYRNVDPYTAPVYLSAHQNYLILPDEEYDANTGKVKEPGQYKIEPTTPEPSANDLGDQDDQPF